MTQNLKPKNTPAIIDRNICYTGKWLNFEKITYKDSNGQIRSWENIQRTSSRGAAAIVASLRPSNKLVLIRQFRPPVNNYIIEFPAGLIDEGESCQVSALRELKEETGYIGKITKTTKPVYNSPGLTDESISIVFVDIDENDPKNINPEPCNEGSEDIQVFLVERNMLGEFLDEQENLGDKVDSKVMAYALAMQS